MKAGIKMALLLTAWAPQVGWAFAPDATVSARVASAPADTSVAPQPRTNPPAKQLYAQLRGSGVRMKARELILYNDQTQATVALEVENSSGKVLSMAVASLMLGGCQTYNSTFRGLTPVSHKTSADVMKFSNDDLRSVDPGEKFLVSIKTGTYDLTCRTLSQAREVDVSLDLWVFNGKEGARVPLRVTAEVQVAR